MKILLICDYYYPFNPGGTEWSVFELAQSLKNKKNEPVIVTLNYGALNEDTYGDVRIVRMPFLKKLNSQRKVVNPIWQNNPGFFILSAFQIFRVIKKEKADLIHVHGKFLIPAAIIAGFITQKPVTLSIRDKQLLCSIGKCFFNKDREKACNFFEYLTQDFPWFYKNYVQDKNIFKLFYIFFGAIWTRLAHSVIKFFAKRSSQVIAISNSQKSYLEANGFKNVKVIYNTAYFDKQIENKVSKTKTVVFAGKLSKGKGAEVLASAIKSLAKKEKIEFLFAGAADLKSLFKHSSHIKFLGNLDHNKLAMLYSKASAVVMPSIYPEAFGRVALEALACGTPAVVSNIGGLPEIVEDRKTGRVVEPEVKNLVEAILDVIRNEREYKDNIKKEYSKLKKRFHDIPIRQHLALYRSLVK